VLVDVDVLLEVPITGPPGVTAVSADATAEESEGEDEDEDEDEVRVMVVVVKPVEIISVSVVVVVAVGPDQSGRVKLVVRPSVRVIVVDWALTIARNAATSRADEREGIVCLGAKGQLGLIFYVNDRLYVWWCRRGGMVTVLIMYRGASWHYL
jgi:hypothetical protein